jgi:hypothetical protein
VEEQHAQVAKWLWAVQLGLIPRTKYSVEPNNDDLLDYMELRHSQHIIPHNNLFGAPPTAGAPPVFPAAYQVIAPNPQGNNQARAALNVLNLLQVSIACQAGALEQIKSNAEETHIFDRKKEAKKKDRFVKFHPSSTQMILFASASDPFDVPNEPEDSC